MALLAALTGKRKNVLWKDSFFLFFYSCQNNYNEISWNTQEKSAPLFLAHCKRYIYETAIIIRCLCAGDGNFILRDDNIVALSKRLNPIIRGWYNYFGKYCPSEAFRKGINYVNLKLVRWLERTRKSVRRSLTKAQRLLHCVAMSSPEMFYHWKVGYMPVKWWQEPYDARVSRTVPWEVWGETPLIYSTEMEL